MCSIRLAARHVCQVLASVKGTIVLDSLRTRVSSIALSVSVRACVCTQACSTSQTDSYSSRETLVRMCAQIDNESAKGVGARCDVWSQVIMRRDNATRAVLTSRHVIAPPSHSHHQSLPPTHTHLTSTPHPNLLLLIATSVFNLGKELVLKFKPGFAPRIL